MKISKQLKKSGKAIIDGPKVKQRKKFAPPSKTHSPVKGGGSYNRTNKFETEEDEETIKENHIIADFVEAVIEKRYADAHKLMNDAVALKIQNKIAKELNTPLF